MILNLIHQIIMIINISYQLVTNRKIYQHLLMINLTIKIKVIYLISKLELLRLSEMI
jgi:hypothetical protein